MGFCNILLESLTAESSSSVISETAIPELLNDLPEDDTKEICNELFGLITVNSNVSENKVSDSIVLNDNVSNNIGNSKTVMDTETQGLLKKSSIKADLSELSKKDITYVQETKTTATATAATAGDNSQEEIEATKIIQKNSLTSEVTDKTNVINLANELPEVNLVNERQTKKAILKDVKSDNKKVENAVAKAVVSEISDKIEVVNKDESSLTSYNSIAKGSLSKEEKVLNVKIDNPTIKIENPTIKIENPTIKIENADNIVSFAETSIEFSAKTTGTTEVENAVMAKTSDIVSQLTKPIKEEANKGINSSFKLKLKPEGLGEVTIDLKNDSGKLNIIIKTELSSTKELILEGIDALRIEIAGKNSNTYQLSSITVEQETNQFGTMLSGGQYSGGRESNQSTNAKNDNNFQYNQSSDSYEIETTFTSARYKTGIFDYRA